MRGRTRRTECAHPGPDRGTREDEVLLLVSNRGAIPRATLDVLFSPFKPRERYSRGLGLGLYIVDQIVRAHGGTLQLEPDAANTCARVCLPRRAAPPAPV